MRKILRFILLGIIAVLCAVMLAFAISYIYDYVFKTTPEISYESFDGLDNTKPTDADIAEHIVGPDQPRYMTIARLNIYNARVVGLSTTGVDNRLGDPANIYDVGWYLDSAKPGLADARFTAGLYDGHNNGGYDQGVFYHLGELVYGDQILIERGDGAMFTYEVREASTVPTNNIEMSIMQRSVLAGTEGLNIISCGGQWDWNANTYTHRVLIRAVLIESNP
jgi:hypothetical protein